eukprot:SAG31_NODE_41556_length_275_cov_1.034091_1_plen_65_part_10
MGSNPGFVPPEPDGRVTKAAFAAKFAALYGSRKVESIDGPKLCAAFTALGADVTENDQSICEGAV